MEWALSVLARSWSKVIWAPGNHELWTPRNDTVQLRGAHRYQHLVEMCRRLGVLTPEDPYAVWQAANGPVTVVPMFLLYDYTFLPAGVMSIPWFRRDLSYAALHLWSLFLRASVMVR